MASVFLQGTPLDIVLLYQPEIMFFQIKPVWSANSPDGFSSIVTSRGSPYYPFLSHEVLRLIESGIVEQAMLQGQTKSTDCGDSANKAHPLSMNRMISLMLIPIIGTLIALILFGMEQLFPNLFWSKPPRKLILKEVVAAFNQIDFDLLERLSLDVTQLTTMKQNAKAELSKCGGSL